jgi:hypothetical protein
MSSHAVAYQAVPPSPFEQLAHRIHRQVNSPAAQLRRRTVIAREAGERVDDWDLLIEQLGAEDSVRMTYLEDGAIQLCWTNQHPG